MQLNRRMTLEFGWIVAMYVTHLGFLFYTFDLKSPFWRVGHVQTTKATIGRVSVGANSQQVYVSMAYPRHLMQIIIQLGV